MGADLATILFGYSKLRQIAIKLRSFREASGNEMPTTRKMKSSIALDRIVAEARRNRECRESGYREKSLKMYPWICGRCSREFKRENLHELTVHHRDHNHENNPEDGSNWELLCLYCHDNEHQRLVEGSHGVAELGVKSIKNIATYSPFSDLEGLLKTKTP